MPRIPIYGVDMFGVIADLPEDKIPPEAWTDALNMRFLDGRAQRFLGHAQVMNPPSVAPGFVMSVESSDGVFWLYASAVGAGSKVYAFNSGAHADVSKSGDYTVTQFRDWNGLVFHGIPILNHGNGAPQYWSAPSLANDLADLTNWPANHTAKRISWLKNYLVALNITNNDGTFIHRVMWSQFAEVGQLPPSWDILDPEVDASARELTDVNSGGIQDGIPLRDMLAIYKNDSTWLMKFIGGQDIMGFSPVLQTSGILGPRCACPLTLPIDKAQVHFVMNGSDLGTFNGQNFESRIEDKVRKYLMNDIDSINYQNAFVLDNPTQDEAWFCYPEVGEVRPSKALVWNYRDNRAKFRDFVGVHASSGVVEQSSGNTWATIMGTWDDVQAALWQEGARRKLVVADQANTKLLQLDAGATFNGDAFSSMLERRGLAVTGVDPRTNQPVASFDSFKVLHRVWPKITGGRVRVTVGFLNEMSAQPFYSYDPIPGAASNTAIFDPLGSVPYVDVYTNGRLLAIKFEGVDGDYWEMRGYDLEIESMGTL